MFLFSVSTSHISPRAFHRPPRMFHRVLTTYIPYLQSNTKQKYPQDPSIVDSTCFVPAKKSTRENFLALIQVESKAHRCLSIRTKT